MVFVLIRLKINSYRRKQTEPEQKIRFDSGNNPTYKKVPFPVVFHTFD